MSKKLTIDYIRMRTKCDRLESLKNLNLWGCDLEDISVVKDLYNLEVVSLSINKIKTLRHFASLKNLKELYIRKNMISDITEVVLLKKCTNLRILWLNENPLAETKNYRAYVIKNLPQITKLDDVLISNEEKEMAKNMNFDAIDDEIDETDVNERKEEHSDEEYHAKSSQDEEENYDVYVQPKHSNRNNHSNNNIIHINNNQRNSLKEEVPKQEINSKKVDMGNNYNRKLSDNALVNIKGQKGGEKIERFNSQVIKPNNKYEDEEKERYQKKVIHNYQKEVLHSSQDESPIQKKIVYRENSEPIAHHTHNNKVKNETVVNCILMLINELNIDDLMTIRKELNKQIKNYDD